MKDNFYEVEQRVKRYWFSDGIAEISVGGIFILLGLYFGVQGYFGEGSMLAVILQVSMVLIMIGGVLGARRLVNNLKTRITYPRTGYVEYHAGDKTSNRQRYITMGLALIGAVALIALINFIRGVDSMVLATGIIVGAVFIVLRGKSSGVTRFYYLGGFSLMLGVGLSFDNLSQAYNLALFNGLLGIVILVSGALVLSRYLKENPQPVEESNE